MIQNGVAVAIRVDIIDQIIVFEVINSRVVHNFSIYIHYVRDLMAMDITVKIKLARVN